jgi:hypothetical protein
MKDRTILQTITDTLEAAGIGVSGIETWPPEEDGRVSVSMTIRPRPEPETKTDVCAFIETFFEYNPAHCETVNTVYEVYKEYRSADPGRKVSRYRFIREILKFFREAGRRVEYKVIHNDDENTVEPCFINVCLRPCDPDQKTAAALDAINADKAPDDPPAVRDPCGECANPDCFSCSLKDGTPIKLYDPKEAAAAMLAGRVLRDERGYFHFWKDCGKDKVGFWFRDEMGNVLPTNHFIGLYEEAKYV